MARNDHSDLRSLSEKREDALGQAALYRDGLRHSEPHWLIRFWYVWALLGFAGLASAQAVLKVSAIPDEAPTELQRKFAPLGKYLEKETGMKVEFVPVTDYAAVVESLATGKIDMAWLGGFTYVQSKIRTKGATIPIVQRQEDTAFTSKFIHT